MKNAKLLTLLWLISWVLFAGPQEKGVQRPLFVDFSGINRYSTYTIVTKAACLTTIRLPEGQLCADLLCGDFDNWISKPSPGEKNQLPFVVVEPRTTGLETSISIHTTSGEIYNFHLVEERAAKEKYVATVIIQNTRRVILSFNEEIKPAENRLEKSEDSNEKKEEDINVIIRKWFVDGKYRVKGEQFSIEKVADDGVFTYIYLPRTQERPAIFYRDERQGKDVEPLRYFDKGTYFVLHRALKDKREAFILKLGSYETKISIR